MEQASALWTYIIGVAWNSHRSGVPYAGEGAIADAVIDRIVYRSDVIHIEGDESMRKRIG